MAWHQSKIVPLDGDLFKLTIKANGPLAGYRVRGKKVENKISWASVIFPGTGAQDEITRGRHFVPKSGSSSSNRKIDGVIFISGLMQGVDDHGGSVQVVPRDLGCSSLVDGPADELARAVFMKWRCCNRISAHGAAMGTRPQPVGGSEPDGLSPRDEELEADHSPVRIHPVTMELDISRIIVTDPNDCVTSAGGIDSWENQEAAFLRGIAHVLCSQPYGATNQDQATSQN